MTTNLWSNTHIPNSKGLPPIRVLAIHHLLYVSTAHAANFTFANFNILPPPCQAQTIHFAYFTLSFVPTLIKEFLPNKSKKIIIKKWCPIKNTFSEQVRLIRAWFSLKHLNFLPFRAILYTLKQISPYGYENTKLGKNLFFFIKYMISILSGSADPQSQRHKGFVNATICGSIHRFTI